MWVDKVVDKLYWEKKLYFLSVNDFGKKNRWALDVKKNNDSLKSLFWFFNTFSIDTFINKKKARNTTLLSLKYKINNIMRIQAFKNQLFSARNILKNISIKQKSNKFFIKEIKSLKTYSHTTTMQFTNIFHFKFNINQNDKPLTFFTSIAALGSSIIFNLGFTKLLLFLFK